MDTNTMTPDQLHGFVAFFVSLWLFIAVFAIGVRALMVWFFWRIFDRAGFNGAIALINLVPLGNLVSVLILAFAEWPSRDRGSLRPTPSTG